jgi:hypothetical protein
LSAKAKAQKPGPRAGGPASKDGFKVPKLPKQKKKSRGTPGASAKAGVQCGAKKRGGGKCTLAAGWGTNHPGIGSCKLHGGSVPNHVKAAARDEYRTLFGKPAEINPVEAILKCIAIRNGEINWLSERMANLQEREWIEDTLMGRQFNLYARERRAALNDLARYSQMALSMDLSARAVKLAESYGETLATLLHGVLYDPELALTPEQLAVAPVVVRRHLILLQGGGEQERHDVIEGKAKEITERAAA